MKNYTAGRQAFRGEAPLCGAEGFPIAIGMDFKASGFYKYFQIALALELSKQRCF
jgi:hypothetical protein